MQIPAGFDRQGSAEKMTDGDNITGGLSRTCSVIEIHRPKGCKTILWAEHLLSSRIEGNCEPSKLAFGCILCRRHHPSGDLSHMFSGIGELTLQEFRLNAHGLLEVGGMKKTPGMFEPSLHILF